MCTQAIQDAAAAKGLHVSETSAYWRHLAQIERGLAPARRRQALGAKMYLISLREAEAYDKQAAKLEAIGQ